MCTADYSVGVKCLVFSDKPVPVSEQTGVEEDGFGYWGLAKGLAAHGISVTVAYNEGDLKEPFTAESEGISIRTYSECSIPQFVVGFDSVLVGYGMGRLMVAVADAIRPNQQLILDCQQPIYAVASALAPADLRRELRSFEEHVKRLSLVLRRVDLLFCASNAQKTFYQGVLASQGRINPITYGDNPILILPQELAEQIEAHTRSKDLELSGSFEKVAGPILSPTARVQRKVKKAIEHLKKEGVRATARRAGAFAARKLGAVPANMDGPPRIVIVSHQLDLSGAPIVAIDVATELKRRSPETPLEFYSFLREEPHRDNLAKLKKAGIVPRIFPNPEDTLPFRTGDLLVLNSTAQSHSLLNQLFTGLPTGRPGKLFWYVHEDEPELQFRPVDRPLIQDMMGKGRLQIWSVAQQTLRNYQRFFGNNGAVRLQPCRLDVPETFRRERSPSDFREKVRFILAGTARDGRKGHLPIFYAFAEFYRRYFRANPTMYREFELVFVGIGADFLSQQVVNHESVLEGRVKTFRKLSREQYLEQLMAANFSICYSLRESLPMSVFEGMVVGHPILRNDCSGMEEQLKPGENGFFLGSDDFMSVAVVIEQVMNVDKTSDALLAQMSAESVRLAAPYRNIRYESLIRELLEDYGAVQDSFQKA